MKARVKCEHPGCEKKAKNVCIKKGQNVCKKHMKKI